MAKCADLNNAIAICALVACQSAFALPDIQVQGLMPNQAVVTIDGKQRILKVGKPGTDGVNLISADSKKATLEWQGERFERTLNKQITSNFSAPAEKSEVRIERGINGHYNTPGHINGRLVNFMVDTGATAIAMNHAEADRLGISWRQGMRTIAGTAGGDTPSYMVTLDTVTVGGVTLHNVQAAVIVADTDNDILLGMTFLERTEMREENNALVLRKKY
jgi:aspartyl protease family protein